MSEQLVVREPARPLKRAVRAAALVLVVTGASGAVAQFVPFYGPLYVYVAALITIAWLEGVAVGLIGAAVALGAYRMLFGTAAFLTLRSWIVVVALTVVLLLAVWIARRLRRPKVVRSLAVPS